MKKKKINNYAFIDSQNLNLAIRELGWKLDFARFRVYLSEKYHVTKAYLFKRRNCDIKRKNPRRTSLVGRFPW